MARPDREVPSVTLADFTLSFVQDGDDPGVGTLFITDTSSGRLVAESAVDAVTRAAWDRLMHALDL